MTPLTRLRCSWFRRRFAWCLPCLWMMIGGSGLMAQALDWQDGKGYRVARLDVPPTGKAGFAKLPPGETGVSFSNQLSEAKASYNRNLENGSGVALGDVDGDGFCDVYLAGLEGGNRLFRNLGGWKFKEVTAASGVACESQYSTGAAFADVDGDGDLDLLVNALGAGTRLFLNDGQGNFQEKEDAGLSRKYGATSMALADVDGDGDLDLYVTNYRENNSKDFPPGVRPDIQWVNGQPVAAPADRFFAMKNKTGDGVVVIELGEPDFLYLNDGSGSFRPVSWTGGVFRDAGGQPLTAPPRDWGLSVMLRDVNGDRAPDIYVCNDFFYSRDQFWINDGNGRFHPIRKDAQSSISESSMSVDFADFNRDGRDDFLVVDMLSRFHRIRLNQQSSPIKSQIEWPLEDPDFSPEFMRNTLFLNRGDGTYAEIARLAGLQASEWSWSTAFLDVDLDGYEDVLITNGHSHDVLNRDAMARLSKEQRDLSPEGRLRQLRQFPPLRTANLAFRNQGDFTFKEVGAEWGFDDQGVSHGMAFGDLDNDGDLDVVVNNFNAPAAIYRNETAAPRIAVRLKGRGKNTRGVGARVTVKGGPVAQSQEMISGDRYLSSDESMRVFAAGDETNLFTIEVQWRGGKTSVIENAHANCVYEIDETGRETTTDAKTGEPDSQPLFQDVSDLIESVHEEEPFDDFNRQPSLARRLSNSGPGLAWYDLDHDGWDELIVGAGRKSRLEVFRNQSAKRFLSIQGPTVPRDQTSILGWLAGDARSMLLAGVSNYEDGLTAGASVRYYDFFHNEIDELLPARASSTGPMAMADTDGDGDLDLFVGGQVIPGKYPEPASSMLYRNEADRFAPDEINNPQLQEIGLVNGAVFSDLNNDGAPDLILALEWGAVRVLINEGGKFTDQTDALGLGDFKGWWQGVATGDFNRDGLLDIIATNWGRNTDYQTHLKKPVRAYFGDFDNKGTVEMIESYYDDTLKKWVPFRNWDAVSRALPYVKARFESNGAFAEASVEEILGDFYRQAAVLEVNTFDSMIFLNRGGKFEGKSLPIEAQFAPAFGVRGGDFDGDGNEDAFLAQNFFAVPDATSRYDAGLGLLLIGDGKGGFTPMKAVDSGIRIHGQQRACAAGDFNRDGRPDLAVGQNRGRTRLFQNATGRPGLRVRVQGPKGNPDGVGAQLALQFENGRRGLLREIQSGSGYWTQNSSIAILPWNEKATELWIRWPGGREITVSIPQDSKEITVDLTGNAKKTL